MTTASNSIPTPPKVVGPPVATTSAEKKMEDCWDRIRAQVPPTRMNLRSQMEPIVGEWYYKAGEEPKDEGSASGKFLLALAKAGLLDGRKVKRDDVEAERLLQDAMKLDPQNTALYMYAAVLAERSGDHDKAMKYVEQGEFAGRFDTYVTTFTRTLYSQVRTPADLMEASEIWSQAPVPDYSALKKFIVDNNFSYVAHKMAMATLATTREFIDIDWLPVEYNAARSALGAMGFTEYPAYDKLMKKRDENSTFGGERVVQNLESSCDIHSIESYVTVLQEHLAKPRGPVVPMMEKDFDSGADLMY